MCLCHMQGGALFSATQATITEVALVGVEVRDEGSTATLADCTLKGFLPLYSDTFAVRGVHVHRGGSIKLTDTSHDLSAVTAFECEPAPHGVRV